VAEVIAANKPAVMILEDYNKGVLTPNTITAIIGIAREAGVPIAVDPKKRNFFCYKGVELFKPNLKELREGLKVDVEAHDLAGIRNAVTLLEEQLGNQASMITLSEHGMYIRQGRTEHVIPAHVRKIVDVSGAGDTVISVAALALALKKTPLEIAELANLAGGLVCEEVGVVPIDPVRLKQEMERLATPA
jgi:D-glycero-beta-D-manno-heptose-7-phosphate kinase